MCKVSGKRKKLYVHHIRKWASASSLRFDVNNGIARRSWARNTNAQFAIKREMERNKNLKITLAQGVKDDLLDNLFN